MSKELEALKFIKNVEVEIGNDLNTATKVFELNHEYDKAFEIVETALKDYDMLAEEYHLMRKDYEQDRKKLKAFEMIKEKRVDIELLMKTQNASDYNKFSKNVNQSHNLGQREFDFLKEVML